MISILSKGIELFQFYFRICQKVKANFEMIKFLLDNMIWST